MRRAALRHTALLCASALLLAMGGPPASITIHLIGDSTMADKPDPEHNPERGWGQAFPSLVREGVVVRSHAVNGRSTKSFMDEGRWRAVREALVPGDVVFIQFGHNDQKREDSTRYAAADTDYRRNLAQFVRETRAAGATPVLFTSIVRRQFDSTGALVDTHGEYPRVVRDIAREHTVPLIDLEQRTAAWVREAGVAGSVPFFVHTAAGEFPRFPAARVDNTHLSPRGAAAVAGMVVEALRALNAELATLVR